MELLTQKYDSAEAIKHMVNDLTDDGYYVYVAMFFSPVTLVDFIASWGIWNPLNYNKGNGIVFNQIVGGIITSVWNQ